MIKFSLEQDNYWLIQYQKLLDAKPKGLQEAERAVDAKVKEILEAAGAEEYVPVFALKAVTVSQLAAMNDKDLSEVSQTETTKVRDLHGDHSGQRPSCIYAQFAAS